MKFYCTQCGTVANPARKVKGSFLVEVALWLLFCAPGLIYSLWRASSAYKACPKCESPNVIPENSPMAQQMLSRMAPPSAPPPAQ